MSKEAVAERMLEMVTTSQRAASIVGDLEEEGSNRSASWFWLNLLRIFVSHLFQDLRAHWLRMIWLGFSEFVIFVIVAIFVVGEIIEVKSYFKPYLAIAHYLYYVFPILLGWHIARRSHGLELASGVSLISVFWIFMAVQVLPLFWIPAGVLPVEYVPMQREPFTALMHAMFFVTPFNTLIILGALLWRYRMNVRRRKLQLS